MAAVTFPDPAANNPATGAPYGDGWFNAANGVTYKFENNVWSAITEPNTSLDDRYVEVAGDNMTGNLTLGTDKITLNATDGTATFAGDLTAGNAPFGFNANGTQIQNNGGVLISTDNSLNEIIYGGTTGGEKTVSIKANGFAKFGGVDYSQTLYESGTIELYNKDWPNATNALDVKGGAGSVAKILGDGSAEFAGGDINLTADGDISFTPPAGVAGVQSRLIWTTEAPFLDEVASIEASRAGDTNAATSLTFNTGGGTAGSLKQALSLNADGSAEFKGAFTCFGKNGTAAKVAISNPSNRVTVVGYNASSINTFKIDAENGSAEFTGGDAKIDIVNGGGGVNLTATGSALRSLYSWNEAIGFKSNSAMWKLDNNTGNITGTVVRSAGLELELERDNPANYTTTTDSEGNETQVYNGPTLDVKEKLQEALATIADLQTRIAALEAA